MEDKEPFILYSQWHDWWWLGDTRSQGINSHEFDLSPLVYCGFSKRWVKISHQLVFVYWHMAYVYTHWCCCFDMQTFDQGYGLKCYKIISWFWSIDTLPKILIMSKFYVMFLENDRRILIRKFQIIINFVWYFLYKVFVFIDVVG